MNTNPKILDIAGRKVGVGQPRFIIAEAGVNHNGISEMAYQLIDVAVQAGADAVKFQTFKADRLVTPNVPKAGYQLETTDAGESQYEMLQRLELSRETHQELITYCRQKGILFMSSPFDEESADLLVDLGIEVFKLPSGEIANLPFLAHVARMGKPMIVSTGMAYLGEVETAVSAIREAGNRDFVLLHCVSNYPANPVDANLRAMRTMAMSFGAPVGFSDHTLGIEVAVAAVALGACVIEKHFTLDRSLPGPDHRASLEPAELTALVRGIRTVEAALGDGRKEPTASEANTAAIARKSLVAAREILAGSVLTEEMIAIKRPGTGLKPAMRPYLIHRTARKTIPEGTLLRLEMLA
ncbi:MAG: N-acetylneuraminate synthase [Arenicellales bacterium]|nr:N-acetylneuraminate synthase [Arenicellales bacterium]|tara:strand:+ start:4737 stop:5798 length:1062 start_codon:yes stop_codon:yes gene_type:complete